MLITFLFSIVSPSDISSDREDLHEKNWRHIDEHVLKTPRLTERRIVRLADYFLKVAETDAEKSRAIYRWITDRITFDRDAFFHNKLVRVTGREVLQSRKAVCSGYVILFQDLARAMGLKVRIIDGHSKGYGFNPGDGSTLLENHSWIAVEVDGVWQLIDPTWGAGYLLADSGEFVPHFSEYYFFTDPDQLIFTHFPRDEKWQLLEHPISETEYQELSVVTSFFFQWGLDFVEDPNLYIETDGKFSTHFKIPEKITVRCLVTHTETDQTENVLFQFKNERLDISTVLRKEGAYKLELYASKLNEHNDFKRVVYFYLNNTGSKELKTVPLLFGSYELNRVSLESPLHYELTDTLAYDFRITIPEAEEAYLMNVARKMYYPLEGDGNDFHGNIIPGPGKVRIIARFPTDKDNFLVLVEFEGVK